MDLVCHYPTHAVAGGRVSNTALFISAGPAAVKAGVLQAASKQWQDSQTVPLSYSKIIFFTLWKNNFISLRHHVASENQAMSLFSLTFFALQQLQPYAQKKYFYCDTPAQGKFGV